MSEDSRQESEGDDGVNAMPSVSSQLLAYSAMGICGYLLTNQLVPNIKVCARLYSKLSLRLLSPPRKT